MGPKENSRNICKNISGKTVPSLSSVKGILDKAGLVEKRKTRELASSDCSRLQQKIQMNKPIDVWCIDFKGFWKADGEI